jgi:hypothetical protein
VTNLGHVTLFYRYPAACGGVLHWHPHPLPLPFRERGLDAILGEACLEVPMISAVDIDFLVGDYSGGFYVEVKV